MFSLPLRIYWEDTDAGGVVYHAQYVAFCERARSEWMRHRGFGQVDVRERFGVVFAVRAMQMDFRAPARLDDAVTVTAGLAECRAASAVFAQEVRRDGEALVTARVRVASLDAATFRPRAIPDALLALLRAHVEPD